MDKPYLLPVWDTQNGLMTQTEALTDCKKICRFFNVLAYFRLSLQQAHCSIFVHDQAATVVKASYAKAARCVYASPMTAPSTVYLFGTCLIDLFYPKAGMASLQLLEQAGVKVIFPPEQSCCGQPAYNSGFRDEALRVARAQLGCFPDDFPILVPSASCAGMMKHQWPVLFVGEADAARATAVAARVVELSEFLLTRLDYQPQDLGEPIKIAVHQSCSAQREMGVAQHTDALLRRLRNVQLVEHAYNTECCGFGGTFAVKQAAISGAMAEDKARHLRDSGAARVISQDCGCLMNISGVLEKHQAALACQHIAEFLLERTHGSGE